MSNTNTQYTKQEDFITVSELWYLCLQHWSWFVLSLALFIGLAEYHLHTTTKMYTREAAILVKLEAGGRASTGKNGEEFKDLSLVQQATNINNVQRHLQSLDVAMGVVKKLHLAEGEKILPKAQNLLNGLKVSLENKESTVINLKYVHADPQQAEEILYAFVDVYNEKWQEDRNLIAANTSKFIIDRLALLSDELEGIDDSISVFKSNNQITDLERVSDIYLQQQNQSEAQILTLTNQKTIAEYILSIIKDKSAKHQLLPTNSGINNQAAETQIAQYNNQILQINNHLTYTSAQNPIVERMEKELAELRKNILRTIESHIKSLDIQLSALYGYSGQAENKITDNPNQAKRLTSIERQQKVKESLYLYLLQKKEENEIASTYNTSTITQMIDIPHGSNFPTSPNSRNVLFIAVMLGLILPTGVIFIRANMDNSVRDRRDLERKTTIPLVGEVPFCPKSVINDAQKQIADTFGVRMHSRKAALRPVVVSPGLHNRVNEAFRVIRTNLEFMTDEKSRQHNVYVITSSNANSGKTFISMNLSIAMAIAQKNVLFIDADLRHASASSSWFHGKKDGGLGVSDYLSGKVEDVHSILRHHANYETLDFLPVGTVPPNPTELLSSDRLGEVLETLRSEYDYIFIDCPPAIQLADTTLIERYADRTLFVIRVGLFDRSRLANLEDDYAVGKYKNMSIILNSSKPNHHGSGNGYDYDVYYYSERSVRNPFSAIMNKFKFGVVCPFLLLSLGLTSCNEETYSELDRVKTGFLERIQGQIDSSHLWRTAVKVKVKITSDRPVTVSSQVVVDGKKVITDCKSLLSGGGEITLTAPQGLGEQVTISSTNGTKTVSHRLTLNGSLVQTVSIDMESGITRATSAPLEEPVVPASVKAPSKVAEKDEWGNHHAPNPVLWGNSYLRPEDTPLYYTNWPVDTWRYVCCFADESTDPSTLDETVNFELVSKGPFYVTLFSGRHSGVTAATWGYYYYSDDSFADYQEVDLCDIHLYDYLDGKPIIQYKRLGEWWDANYDMFDFKSGYVGLRKERTGDECYNSVDIAKHYDDVTDMRGLTFHIDVPVGKRLGFYIRRDGNDFIMQELAQKKLLQQIGLPVDRMHSPFKITCFTSKDLNKSYDPSKPYRGWIHMESDYYFMGLENDWNPTTCDHDCNDVMFAMSPGVVGVLPDVIDLDNEEDTPGVSPDEPPVNLSWTLAFEDVYRNADFDFNDGVIRIDSDYENETACVTVLAAGIDEQVFLHYAAPDGTDMVLGELHELLGRTSDRPVNTGSSSLEVPGVQVDCVPWPEGFTMANDASRFTLEVIRGNCHGECSDWLTLTDDPGQVPEAILVAGNWQWPKEGVHITNTYSHFNYWAKDATNTAYWEWYHTPKTGTYVSY